MPPRKVYGILCSILTSNFYKNVENVLVLDLDRDRKDSKAFPSLYKVEAMQSQIQ